MFQKPIEIMEKNPQSVLKPQPPIQPYVCSTIKDFQEERDFLANNIFPQLNKLCNSRGTYFKAIDLRWPASEAHDPLCPNFRRQYCSLQSQQLKLCLDYINNSFPFFLCMLGQTYGEFLREDATFLPTGTPDLPGLSKVEKNLYVAAHNGYPWVLENFTCSLTELEVIQAAFMNDSKFQYYYFRTGAMLLKALEQEKGKITCPQSRQKEYEKRRIGELKAKIISKGLPVRFYRDLHELGELVFKDWSTVIEKLYPASVLPENVDYEHIFERSYHEAFTAKCRKMFVLSKESKQVFDALEKFVMKDPQNEAGKQESGSSLESILRIRPILPTKSILLLSGERGCGKSTLIASWVNSFRERNPDALVIPYYIGSSCDRSDIMSVMHYFITELQYKQFGTPIETDLINEDSKVWVFSLLVEIFLASISLKPCILVLDGIEELVGVYGISGQKAKDFSWLPPSISPNCKLIMSMVSSSFSYKSLCARSDVKTVELTVASDENTVIKIFEQYLTVPHKNIFSYREKHNSRKKPCLSPLKVAVLANEFQECRLYRNESECIQEYLEVLSIQELWELILKRWVEDYSWIIKPKKVVSAVPDTKSRLSGWVVDTLCLLSVSHCGLTDLELLQLLDILGYKNHYKVTTSHWAAFRLATKQWIQEKPNGRLHFCHQSLRQAVEHKLLGVITPVRESSPYSFQNPMNCKKTNLHRILTQFFQRQSSFWRAYAELPWHLKMSGNWEELCNFLTHPKTLAIISQTTRPTFWIKLHLIHYWNVLAEAGCDTTGAYLSMVKKMVTYKTYKIKERHMWTELNCKISDFTTNEKCQLICFVARFLNYLGRTNDAEELFITAEDLLIKHDLESEILFKVQLSLGELYLEIGSLQKAFYFFQRAWVTWRQLAPSGSHNLERLKQKGRVLHNLAKTMSQGSVKENHLLENTVDLSKQLAGSPYDFAMLRCTEGILKSLGGNFSIAKLKFQECLSIRKSLFGENHFLVGEIKEYLADLISGHKKTEKFQRKNAVEYYRGVINIKENMELLTNSFQVKKQLNISLSNIMCKLAGQLIKIDVSDQCEQEVTGFLHRALDLRVTYLGPSHSSTSELLRLLREFERKGQNKGSLQSRSSNHESFKGILVQEKISKRRLEYHRPQNFGALKSPVSSSAAKLQRAMSLDSYKVSEDSGMKSVLGKGQKSTRFITCSPTKEIIKQQVQNNVEIWSCREDSASSKKEKDASGKNTAFGSPENMLKSPRERAPSAASYNWCPQTTISGPFNTIGSLEIPCRPQTSPENRLFQKSGRHITFHKPSPPKRQQTDMRLLKKLSENSKQ
ncbi:putative tetratricopeptide repeat protein 41 isoform X1 [Trichosurus vulpecula]|uniref:putative tetratricopeptide repeat protein 41 isoform X1 n=1 Tax=Trichosurus vulpecula TaxID=9337 RepID=UPI00186B1185|nr:putative tetratricopeptide repeat protein 41 isoform X1 [Trichosurus vulpecula]XP_036615952.1 putative tetratricopeptide repeat protein 41 isoform X1 [Trichosurus vulpecula]XP_036615953.1 putative tetratricopeptide repeat protein 41 isoform X1 [Trichosurus vulpecula]XP_036615954.1 putative tetratricopeptide repeat protein 41 isoform X1 [Trichosurus vulpecula]